MVTSQTGSSSLERYAPLSGVVFAVLAVAALGAWGDVIEPGEAAGVRSDAFVADPQKGLAGAQLLGLAAFALVWFGASLRRVIGVAHDRLAALAYGGTVTSAALLLAGAATHGALALRADELGALDAEAAAVVGDVGTLLVGSAAPIGMALVTAATALAALRTGAVLPAWAAWVSVVLSVALVAMPINYVAVLGFFVWAAALGIVLTARGVGGTSP